MTTDRDDAGARESRPRDGARSGDRSAIILAGGRSSRMGRAKATLPLAGVPLLAHVVARVRPLVAEIVIVAAPEQDLPSVFPAHGIDEAGDAAPVRVIRDETPYPGPLRALALGLEHVRPSTAFVLACDAPLVAPALLDLLARELGDANGVVPIWDDQPQPLVAIYRRTLLPAIETMLRAGEMRMQRLAGVPGVRTLDASTVASADPTGASFVTLNTPEEYEHLVGSSPPGGSLLDRPLPATTNSLAADESAGIDFDTMTQVPELAFESTSTISQADFAEWVAHRPGDDLNHYELLDGRVVMAPPAGYPHGQIDAAIATALGGFIHAHALGRSHGSSQGFDLPTGDTIEPDFSFVSNQRWATMPPPQPGKFLRVVPDLVVEILSRSTASIDRVKKRRIYERNGVREYWIIDPAARTLTVLSRVADGFDEGRTFAAGTTFASHVLSGFELDVETVLP